MLPGFSTWTSPGTAGDRQVLGIHPTIDTFRRSLLNNYLLADGKPFLARVDPRTRARPHQEIQAVSDMARMHSFDPETETAMGG